jgi:hypothetical protein
MPSVWSGNKMYSRPAKLDRARAALFRMYRIRQGIIDALTDYERQLASSQRKSRNPPAS